MAVKATIEGKELVLRLPIEELQPSKSGKTLVVATSHGNKETEAEVNGKKVIVGINAYIPR